MLRNPAISFFIEILYLFSSEVILLRLERINPTFLIIDNCGRISVNM